MKLISVHESNPEPSGEGAQSGTGFMILGKAANGISSLPPLEKAAWFDRGLFLFIR